MKNKIIEIKEEVQIGNVILEKGDKIEILNKLNEEFIEVMYDSRETVAELIKRIVQAYADWRRNMYNHHYDEEAQENGYNSIEEMIEEAKKEIINNLIYNMKAL